ncbi:complement regulator-acquiring protein (plasmid) [Borrelia sp. CA_690]|uniref:Complement regulator-acquiring protein n=1 Tax=Borrelia maritima TaxID=2761123 RepID=A0A5J6WF91_9SPIR|nr:MULTISPECIES: complement regulator-acquiring protein [Borrelia]QFI15002.1 complement regulator-acquiring protein [Borrelia maritima]WKC84009.1 complement regulator-acquiring protein [Borrelia sp. CA_690]
MTKPKLNIIKFKLNTITTILTLICISCAVNKTDPKVNRQTNPKETTQNFEDESRDLKNSNQKSKDLKPLNKESRDLNPASQESREETKVSKSKEILKKMEDQDDEKINTIDKQLDLKDTFKIDSYGDNETEQLQIKRIIYSVLNYDTKKIKMLKEILEKLKKNPEHRNIAKRLIYDISLGIQINLEKNLKLIKEILDKILQEDQKDQENSEALLMELESDLKLKEKLGKTLNATLEAYSKNDKNIKSSEEELAKHMNENYKELDSLRPSH